MYKCKHCGGEFNYRQNLFSHLKDEESKYIVGKENEDYVVCKICGMRAPRLEAHIQRTHKISVEEYKIKYGNNLKSTKCNEKLRKSLSIANTRPLGSHKNDKPCEYCGEITNHRYENYPKHIQVCSQKIKPMILGFDYIVCPECNMKIFDLFQHFRHIHRWDKEKIKEYSKKNQMVCKKNKDKRRATNMRKYGCAEPMGNAGIRDKIKSTMMEKYGIENIFDSKDMQDKIGKTNWAKYGCRYPMQNEEVAIRQKISANVGMSGQEKFFNENTPANVVYTGNGVRFIRCKKGVKKYGRIIKDLNPDFMVFSDNVTPSAIENGANNVPLDRQKHRTRWVIELLGDYYHSEGVIGVDAIQHVKEIKEAYASAGINVLVLWEKQVMEEWIMTKDMIDAWVKNAIKDMNDNPIYAFSPTK